MVFIFAKTPDDALASLVKKLDTVVAENESKKVAAVLNFVGEATDEYLAKTKEFGEKHNLKNVAVTVTADAEQFRVNDEADVTVMHYKGKKVKFNHAVAEGGLNDKAIKAIVDGTSTILE